MSSFQSVALAVVFYSALVFWSPVSRHEASVEVIQIPESKTQMMRERTNTEKDKDDDEEPVIYTV